MVRDFYIKVKNWLWINENEAIWASAVILAGLVGFGIGRIFNINSQKFPIEIRAPQTQAASVVGASEVKPSTAPSEVTEEKPLAKQAPKEKVYVASKNGKTYHLPTCAGAKQIKAENKIWFSSKAEAEKAGYRPAANCKGL